MRQEKRNQKEPDRHVRTLASWSGESMGKMRLAVMVRLLTFQFGKIRILSVVEHFAFRMVLNLPVFTLALRSKADNLFPLAKAAKDHKE